MSRPAFSKKIDAWIDTHLARLLTAIPVGTILIWGIPLFFLAVMAFHWAKKNHSETTSAYIEHLFPNAH